MHRLVFVFFSLCVLVILRVSSSALLGTCDETYSSGFGSNYLRGDFHQAVLFLCSLHGTLECECGSSATLNPLLMLLVFLFDK